MVTLPVWSTLLVLGVVYGAGAVVLISAVFGLGALIIVVVCVASAAFGQLAADVLGGPAESEERSRLY